MNKTIFRFLLCVSLLRVTTGLVASDSSNLQNDEATISLEMEKFIRNIQREVGMESYDIKIIPYKEENAEAGFCYTENDVFLIMKINESWLKKYSLDGQRFTIGHELMHIKREHVFKMKELSCSWPLLSKNIILAINFIFAWNSRQAEVEADLLSVQKLHCAQGAIDSFEKDISEENKRFIKHKIPLCLKWVAYLFADHPSCEARIKYIKVLMASPAYQLVKAA